MLDIVIVGAGGCGREVYEMALETFSPEQYRIKGFLSDIPTDLDKYPETKAEVRIIDTIIDYKVQDDDRFLLAIGDVEGRNKVLESLLDRGAKFLSLIHPKAMVFRNAVLGKGVILYPFVGVSDYAKIGDFCLVNAYTSVGHDAVLEEKSVVCPFVAIGGGARLGASCFVGPHVTVSPKVSVGANSRISANSFVARNAPGESFIIGAPAKNM